VCLWDEKLQVTKIILLFVRARGKGTCFVQKPSRMNYVNSLMDKSLEMKKSVPEAFLQRLRQCVFLIASLSERARE
jgi:hypothetical protein